MPESFETYTEEILSRFKEIDESAHRDIIVFYDRNKNHLLHLDLDAYLEIKISYGTALFETGRYLEFIPLCEDLLEEVIYHNIKFFHGEDIFQKLLFRKAAAFYQLLKFEEAEEILWQILRMDPYNAPATYLLKRCRVKSHSNFLRKAKAISIFLFLLSACIIAIELLIIRPFFDNYSLQVDVARTTIFFTGIFILVFSDGWHRLRSFHDVNKVIESLKEK